MKRLIVFAIAALVALSGSGQTKSPKTVNDLKAGFKGESTASAKYAAFAKKAAVEGNKSIASLFEAASKAEAIHAENHKKVLEGMGEKVESFTPQFEVKTTAENLQAAIDGENYEVSNMYPQFLKDAGDEKVMKAEKSFRWAFETEKKHSQFYAEALKALKDKTVSSLPSAYAVCPVCGNTYDNAKTDANCTFCGTPKTRFFVI
jgi:rubrerythrin